MPVDGIYQKESLTQNEFKKYFQLAQSQGVISYVGYPNLAKILSDFLEYKIEVSRESFVPDEKDWILSATLKYRLAAPGEKALSIHGNALEDYNFSVIKFKKLPVEE